MEFAAAADPEIIFNEFTIRVGSIVQVDSKVRIVLIVRVDMYMITKNII